MGMNSICAVLAD